MGFKILYPSHPNFVLGLALTWPYLLTHIAHIVHFVSSYLPNKARFI